MNQFSGGGQSDLLTLLKNWYASRCDGDWEHQYGVKIDTLDNPGWIVGIDIWETELSGKSVGRFRREFSETDWLDIKITEAKFEANGDVGKLEEIIRQFLFFAQNFHLQGAFDCDA